MTEVSIAQFSAVHPALTTLALFAVCLGIALGIDRLFQHPPRGMAYIPEPTEDEAAETERLMAAATAGRFRSDRELSGVVVPFDRRQAS